ncbi:MAG: TolC family protein, partial [Planctomycetaceae bacterium]|nr:TolC family protein [Planctomycetaceae bacterium]
FKEALLEQVRNIEEAYWSLQASYTTLQALDQILPLLEDAVRIEELRLQAELVTIAEVARVRLQRNEFQQERVRVLADIQRAEYTLRTLLGLPVESRQKFMPIEPPRVEWDNLSLDQSLATAMSYRPDIVQRRLRVRVRELEWKIADNQVFPQWDLTALYRASGISNQFEETFDQIAATKYADWTVGMEFSVPLGNRAARSSRAAAEDQLHRERALYHQHIKNVSYELADLIRDLKATSKEYELAHQRVADSQDWVRTARLRFSSPPSAGRSEDWLLVALDDYQFALRRHIDAVVDASRLLGEYNSLLARLGEAQGTLLEQRLVELDDDPIKNVRDNALNWEGGDVSPQHGWSTGP